METSNVMSAILENQAELMREVKSLRKENQQLRQLLWAPVKIVLLFQFLFLWIWNMYVVSVL